ncbi:LuxR family transcriptional regulator [Aliivibrio finisterrensis]|uniref:LuxR family transcriptional regulator n=1 Tax=Aliivibrio finisterrensis TaxID=511998 RepID=A0A6N6RWF6_9GAMM|nr:LuxR family transcriptional regulator [Aliivibrio finisterrensis]KAB2825770.1 LuxR family transcriptional regulator [Aliivibrio finisterrensis]
MGNLIQCNTINMVIDKINNSKSNTHLNQCLHDITDILDCNYYLFAIISKKSMIKSDILIFDNYPKNWRNHYDKTNLIKHDPVVDYCFSNHSPIHWNELEKKEHKLNKPNVIQEAQTSGLHSGFSFPIHSINGSFGVISFAHSSKEKNVNHAFHTACIHIPTIIPILLDSFHRINKNNTNKDLTKREKECLAWACEGKSSWEISKILGCAERTVTFHLANSQTKLDTTNRCQSVSKAILTGAIDPMY